MSDERSWQDVITVEHIRDFHRVAIARFGGPESVPIDGCLEQCLGNARLAEQYREGKRSEPGVIFAAHLLYYLANDHCYSDGNKRIAWMALTYLLLHYNLTLVVTEDEAVSFMLDVASGEKNTDHALEWIVARLATAP